MYISDRWWEMFIFFFRAPGINFMLNGPEMVNTMKNLII
jgi:hypothetical protein